MAGNGRKETDGGKYEEGNGWRETGGGKRVSASIEDDDDDFM